MIVFPFIEDRAPQQQDLVRWRAWEVQVPSYDAPSWHLIGFLNREGCAKVSSALVHVNRAGNEARSKTGRIYSLASVPGSDASAGCLWQAWQKQHRVTLLRDVTAELLAGRQPSAIRLIQRRTSRDASDMNATSLRGHRAW